MESDSNIFKIFDLNGKTAIVVSRLFHTSGKWLKHNEKNKINPAARDKKPIIDKIRRVNFVFHRIAYLLGG